MGTKREALTFKELRLWIEEHEPAGALWPRLEALLEEAGLRKRPEEDAFTYYYRNLPAPCSDLVEKLGRRRAAWVCVEDDAFLGKGGRPCFVQYREQPVRELELAWLGETSLRLLRVDEEGELLLSVPYASIDRARYARGPDEEALDLIHGEGTTWLKVTPATVHASPLAPFAHALLGRLDALRSSDRPGKY